MNDIFDIIIIGGGPAAMGAIQYLDFNHPLKVLILSDKPIGEFVYNSIKTHDTIDGLFFYEGKKPEQLINFYNKLIITKKIDYKIDFIKNIIKSDNLFILKGSQSKYISRQVLIATGMQNKMYKSYANYENVLYLAGKLSKSDLNNKICVVIGGRNSGTAAAIYLSKLCKTVYLIEQKSKLMCKQKYLDRLSLRKNIITVVNVKDINLIKKTKLQIKSISLTTPEKNIIIDLDYILVYIGLTPNSNLVNSICKLDKIGYIITDNHNETSCKGLFAAGDVTGRLSQIITCHGDGANAIYWIQKNIN